MTPWPTAPLSTLYPVATRADRYVEGPAASSALSAHSALVVVQHERCLHVVSERTLAPWAPRATICSKFATENARRSLPPPLQKSKSRMYDIAPMGGASTHLYAFSQTHDQTDDDMTWGSGQGSVPVTPQPPPRLVTRATPPAAAGPSTSAYDGPVSSRTRSKAKKQ